MGKRSQAYEGARKYNKEWENQSKWLSSGGNACYCKLCNVEINSFRKSVLVQHEQNVKHRKNSDAIPSRGLSKFFKPSASNTSLKEFEIKYSVFIACYGSIRSVDHHSDIIKDYGKKSTLEDVRLHRTKCSKLITNVVARAFSEELVDELKCSKFSLMIDESTDVSVKKILCLCVKHYSKSAKEMKTEFLDLIEVISATGENLFN